MPDAFCARSPSRINPMDATTVEKEEEEFSFDGPEVSPSTQQVEGSVSLAKALAIARVIARAQVQGSRLAQAEFLSRTRSDQPKFNRCRTSCSRSATTPRSPRWSSRCALLRRTAAAGGGSGGIALCAYTLTHTHTHKHHPPIKHKP